LLSLQSHGKSKQLESLFAARILSVSFFHFIPLPNFSALLHFRCHVSRFNHPVGPPLPTFRYSFCSCQQSWRVATPNMIISKTIRCVFPPVLNCFYSLPFI
jgi:hypothetical protein